MARRGEPKRHREGTSVTTIRGIVTGGRLEIVVPADWPDGTEVEILPLASRDAGDREQLSPEEIAAQLTRMDQLEPLALTDAERAAWEAERQARKEWEKSRFAEHAAKLRGEWE
jgi:hypothetical protein